MSCCSRFSGTPQAQPQPRVSQPRFSHHSLSGPRLSQLEVVQEAGLDGAWNGLGDGRRPPLGGSHPRLSSGLLGDDGFGQRTASPLQLPPHGSSPLRARRLSAPVTSAFVDSDDDSELDGAAGGAEEALRQAVTLRALRRRSEARRAARVSENAADAAGLPTPSELAVRISRLDVNLQRFLVTQLVQLEASQAAAQASLAAVAPQHRGVTWASSTVEGAPVEAVGDHHDGAHRPHAHGYQHHHQPLGGRSHSRVDAAVDPDLLEEEGGPVGEAPPADGDGYASPGERDVSASDSDWRTRDDSPPRGLRPGQPPLAKPADRKSPSPHRSRLPRFSLAGVAGELQLPVHGAGEEEEDGVGGNQLSPRLLGPSSVRLAAKRMTHGRLPGDSVLHRGSEEGGRASVLRATAF